MDVKPPFGQWLKQQRQRLDLTQADLARRLGYSTITIHKIEAGDMRPSKQFVELLAGARDAGLESRPAHARRACVVPPARRVREPAHARCDRGRLLRRRFSAILIAQLSGLVWKSLVQPAARAEGTSRYRLLETIREYAMSKLAASGESELLHHKLGEHLLTLTTDLRITHPDDADNWRAALKWAIDSPPSRRLAMDLADVWGPFCISPREAEGWLQQLHDRTAALGDEALRIEVLMNLGTILNVRGDSARARQIFETTLAAPHVRKLRLGVLGSHFMLGLIAREAGDIQASRAHFEYCVQNCSLEAPDYVHWLYSTMAETEIAAEDSDAALRLLAECDHFEPHHPNGAAFLQAWLRIHRARALMLQGDLATAREHLDHSLTVYPLDATDGDSLMASTRQSLGEIALSAGDPAEARDQLRLSLSEHDRRGDATGIAWCLTGLAGAAALDEEPERAAVLWGAGEALRERIERRIAPASRRNRERAMTMLRAQLGEAEFARLAGEGAKMMIDEAVALALAET